MMNDNQEGGKDYLSLESEVGCGRGLINKLLKGLVGSYFIGSKGIRRETDG